MKKEQIRHFLTSYQSIDSAIYSGTSRLRVPLSYKYKHDSNILLKNFHKVPSSWNLEDCFVQNISSCVVVYNPLISKKPYYPALINSPTDFKIMEFHEPEKKIREVFNIPESTEVKKVF